MWSIKGRSDTLFAKLIDKLVLPVGLNKNATNMTSAASKMNNVSNLPQANNQNSVLISLKDTLHHVNI
jgi:hypothetical protein